MQTIQTMRSSRPFVAQSQRVAAANRPTCRPVLPARVRNVHAQVTSRAEVTTPERSAVQQIVQTGTSVQQDAAVSLKHKVTSFIQTTAKAAAVLGVAMALVSVVDCYMWNQSHLRGGTGPLHLLSQVFYLPVLCTI